jgi:uncharacterized membrane protein (UPF0182 family)
VKPRAGRARWWIVGAVVLLIVILASLRSLATLYTDSLWFSSVHFHRVWSTLVAVKVGLFASFGAVFFVVLWVNLVLCDRIGAHDAFGEPEDDLLRRYQRVVRPHAGRVYAVFAFVAALVAAATSVGQWNNWLLFTHATSFPSKDPQFGLNDGFFVFRLPFLEFLVDWALAALFVILLFTALFHYLNGGIRVRSTPHVRPVVKVHLSILLALIALSKAAGYVLQRYALDVSNNGYVEGAGYADVHARLPALDVLFFVSLFAAVILLVNIRRQGWTLPVLAIGVWAFVALVIGVIYPVVLQALKVNPAQSALEQPYIARNIKATRAAYGLQHVTVSHDADKTRVSATTVNADLTTLTNVRLWDPSPLISLADFRTKQAIRQYYTFQSVEVDRYTTHGALRPVIVGVRQINPTDLPSSSWVNTHLHYTHGEGLALAEADQATANGNPVFTVKDVPTTSNKGAPTVRQPAVYFGLQDPGYVIADTTQPELDGLKATGAPLQGHYTGSGGVRLNSFFTRAAFALRLGDLNVLLSNQITANSKMLFVRDVRTMAEKAAPFLSYDSQAYPAVVNGQIDWILDAYTTSSNYPYSENAASLNQDLPTTAAGALPASFNYIRNSVVVVVNAYSGKMTFYAMDRSDPILQAYESAFPTLFTPATQMPTALRAHLRYGNDLFSVQAAVYGRYHITSPEQFYTASDAWVVSPTTGASGQLAVTPRFTHGQVVGGTYTPMTPVYQVMALPGQTTQSFTVTDAFVPAGGGGATDQLLQALLVVNSDPTHFGDFHVYETPPDASKVGPIQADTEIDQTTSVSQEVTLLDQQGSKVLWGNILPLPVGQSVIYVRPLYAESKTVPQPQLKYVITVLGQRVRMKHTLGASLNALLGTTLKSTGGVLTTTPTATAQSPTPPPSKSSSGVSQAEKLLAEAASDYATAQADLKAGTLGGYQKEVAAAQQLTAKAEQLLQGASTGSTSGTSGTAGSGTSGSGTSAGGTSGSGTSGSGTSASSSSSVAPGGSDGSAVAASQAAAKSSTSTRSREATKAAGSGSGSGGTAGGTGAGSTTGGSGAHTGTPGAPANET